MSAHDEVGPPVPNHPDRDQSSEVLDLKSLLKLGRQHYRRMSELLAVIDELDRRIAARIGHKRSQFQARSNVAQEFAKLIDSDPSPYPQLGYATDDGRHVFIAFKVMNYPSRVEEAEAWMASRGQSWNGDGKRLHAVVLKALQDGETLPPGNFGLRVERTIRIANDFADGLRAELPQKLKARMKNLREN